MLNLFITRVIGANLASIILFTLIIGFLSNYNPGLLNKYLSFSSQIAGVFSKSGFTESISEVYLDYKEKIFT